MQEYLNHFLGNLDIVNSPEVLITQIFIHFTLLFPIRINVDQNILSASRLVLSSRVSTKISFKIQVCKFLEVSCLSFLPEYGPKLKEDYVSVGHLPKIQKDHKENCCSCGLFSCCKSSWQKVLYFLQFSFVFSYLIIIVFKILN